MWPFTPPNAPIIASKRDQQRSALTSIQVDAVNGTNSSQYLLATAPEIVDRIASGDWTASQVLEAYIQRAVFAHAKTNCLTEVFFERARERAKALDADFARTGAIVGPLHGVPVSIKDQFEIEGIDSTIGFTSWAGKPATKNADIVAILLEAGAVLYVKTNVPQTMFAFECSNPLFGTTTNPYNDAFTSGGSSGGEGALIAMDGSPLGIGSDIGGSLRIPAAYCGIYSLKPGSGRISYHGARGPVQGFEGIKSVAGPMGRSVDDLFLLSRAAFGKSLGPITNVPPLAFREDVAVVKGKLKFGYYTSDKFVKASPACARAVRETVDALRKAGHECVEVEVPDMSKVTEIFVGLTSSDGYRSMLSNLGADKKEESLWLVTMGAQLPAVIRSPLTWFIESVLGDKIFASAMRAARVKPVSEFWELTAKRDEVALRFQEQMWGKHGLDGIIAPVQALPQLPHGGCTNFSALAMSTILYNVIDVPVGCLPVTRVDPSTDAVDAEWTSAPDHGSKMLKNGIYLAKKKIYDPQLSEGMPVAVQIVGKRWEEEKVLGMMKIVDEVLGKRSFGPGAYEKHSVKQP